MYKYICSLGTICHTGRLLQRLKLKNTSYPFDWVFSDEKIIKDCLEDDFNKFLDPSYYVDVAHPYHPQSCGHSLYHEDFFFHKDPRTDEHYSYYQRCVNRFRTMCQSPDKKLFVVMFSPEQTRHPLDLYEFSLDKSKDQIIEEIKHRGRIIRDSLNKVTSNYKLVVIMNFGGNEIQTYEQFIEGPVDFIELNTISPSQGVTFSGGWNTNRHPDNYYLSGLLSELYTFR